MKIFKVFHFAGLFDEKDVEIHRKWNDEAGQLIVVKNAIENICIEEIEVGD